MLHFSLFLLLPLDVFLKKKDATRLNNGDSLYLSLSSLSLSLSLVVVVGAGAMGATGAAMGAMYESELLLESPKLELSSSSVLLGAKSPFKTVLGDFSCECDDDLPCLKIDESNAASFSSCPIEITEHLFGAYFLQYFLQFPVVLFND